MLAHTKNSKINTFRSKEVAVFSYMLLALGCGIIVGTDMVRVLHMPLSALDRNPSDIHVLATISFGSVSVVLNAPRLNRARP